MPEDTYDHLERRCPRLGGPVSFNYCRTCGDEKIFCQKIADCWWEYFDVAAWLKENLSEEDLNELLTKKPKPKLTGILEIIKTVNSEQQKN
jgi:hypothetical protein